MYNHSHVTPLTLFQLISSSSFTRSLTLTLSLIINLITFTLSLSRETSNAGGSAFSMTWQPQPQAKSMTVAEKVAVSECVCSWGMKATACIASQGDDNWCTLPWSCHSSCRLNSDSSLLAPLCCSLISSLLSSRRMYARCWDSGPVLVPLLASCTSSSGFSCSSSTSFRTVGPSIVPSQVATGHRGGVRCSFASQAHPKRASSSSY